MCTTEKVIQIIENNSNLTKKSWGGKIMKEKKYPLKWAMNIVPSSEVARVSAADICVVKYKNAVVIFNDGKGYEVPHGTTVGRYISIIKKDLCDLVKVVVVTSIDARVGGKDTKTRNVDTYTKHFGIMDRIRLMLSK